MRFLSPILMTLFFFGCAKNYPGPDKQFGGMLQGAASGAGSGAVTGFQVASASGPGALVGAGLGAIAGGVQGALHDTQEERAMMLNEATKQERERALVQEILADHYKRRMELHPTRDIYPADLFFFGDETKLTSLGVPLVKELAKLNKERAPWSRLTITVYAKTSDENSSYAQHLTTKRAKEIGDYMVQFGIEPRRITARSILMKEPVLIDPYDRPERYNEAAELVAEDL